MVDPSVNGKQQSNTNKLTDEGMTETSASIIIKQGGGFILSLPDGAPIPQQLQKRFPAWK